MRTDADEKQINEMQVEEFLEKLSSKAPVPGGGGASALAGALAAALGLMVGNLTVGKKKYAGVEARVKEIMEQLEQLREEMAGLAQKDAQVFALVAAAYALPSGTEEEKAHKDAVMEANLLAASRVPLDAAQKAENLLVLLEELEEKGSVMAVSDVGVAVQMARAAITGAVMNVYINTKSMKNREMARQLNQASEACVRRGTELADRLYGRIQARLLS